MECGYVANLNAFSLFFKKKEKYKMAALFKQIVQHIEAKNGSRHLRLRRSFNKLLRGGGKTRSAAPSDEVLKAALHTMIENRLQRGDASITTEELTDALSRQFGGVDLGRRRALIDQETERYIEHRQRGGGMYGSINSSWRDVAVRRRALEYAATFAPWPSIRRHIGTVLSRPSHARKTALAHGAEFDFVGHFVALDLDTVVCVGRDDPSYYFLSPKAIDYYQADTLWERYFGPDASTLGLTSAPMGAFGPQKFFAKELEGYLSSPAYATRGARRRAVKIHTRHLRYARYKAGLMCALASALSSGAIQYTLTYDQSITRAYRLAIKFLYRGRQRFLVKYFNSVFGTRPAEIEQGIDCFITQGAPGLASPLTSFPEGERLQLEDLVALLHKRPGRKSVFCSHSPCSWSEQEALQFHGVTEQITAHEVLCLGLFAGQDTSTLAPAILLSPLAHLSFAYEWFTVWKQGRLPASKVLLDDAATSRITGAHLDKFLGYFTWDRR